MEKRQPDNWIEIELGQIATVQSGGTPSRGNPNYWGGNIPWVKISDMKHLYVDETEEYITADGLKNSSTRIFPKGTILLTIFATIGKVGILNIDAATNQAIAGITPSENLESKYIAYCLIYLSQSFLNKSKGVAQKNINQTILKESLIPIPPRAEQRRIVEKLNKAFQSIDNIKARWANLNKLRLQYVDECLMDSDAKSYYPRQKLSKYLKESTERIGASWVQARKIGVSAKRGIIDLDTGQKQSFENYKIVRQGDFIYNMMRANIGSIALYEGSELAITSPDYVVFKITEYLSAKLLLSFLKSPIGLMEINANTKGSVRSRLYFKSLCNINYAIAPKAIQKQAEHIISWFSKSLDKYQSTVDSDLNKLSAGLLEKAINGELVPQKVEDEPASALLKSLRQIQKIGK